MNGIPTRKFVVGAFVTSGTLTALAGVLLASKLRIGQASVGLEFLLPALVGAFLGSTTIKPGRVNVWGTIVGVVIPTALTALPIPRSGNRFLRGRGGALPPFFFCCQRILALAENVDLYMIAQ